MVIFGFDVKNIHFNYNLSTSSGNLAWLMLTDAHSWSQICGLLIRLDMELWLIYFQMNHTFSYHSHMLIVWIIYCQTPFCFGECDHHLFLCWLLAVAALPDILHICHWCWGKTVVWSSHVNYSPMTGCDKNISCELYD